MRNSIGAAGMGAGARKRRRRERRRERPRDPLEPLTTAATMLLGLIVLGFAAVIATTIFGSGSYLGFGHTAAICADTDSVSSGTDSQGLIGQARPGVDLMTNGYHLCVLHPSAAQRLWYTLEELPTTLLLVGSVLLVYLLVRNAARHGIYTDAIAGRLRGLGWFLLVGSLIQPALVQIGRLKLLHSMIANSGGELGSGVTYEPILSLLFTGLGILSFARIMRIGVTMHEDLEGTV